MLGGRPLKIFTYFVFTIMVLPILIVLPVAVTTTGYMTFPPVGFTLKWFAEVFKDQILIGALMRSLFLAGVAAICAVVISCLATFPIERQKFRGKNLLETFFTGPRIVPQIILVLGMLFFFNRIGILGAFHGLVLAHVVITFPFAFRTILASVSSLDIELEWAARVLGANWLRIFVSIILPQMKTGFFSSIIFTFITSFNNITMALFLSAPGQRTLPVELFSRLHRGGITPKVPAISFILAFVSIALFIVLDRTIGVFRLGDSQEPIEIDRR